MYDTVVLGATFLAAGVAVRKKKKCLILEESFQAGYEFFGALNYGAGYDAPLKTGEGEALRQKFFGEGETPYTRNTHIYPLLQAADVLFGVQIVSVEKKGERFACTVYGVNGYSSFTAKNVIDTRAGDEISIGKTYNLLVESGEMPQIAGIPAESTGIDRHYVLRCPVPLSGDYGQARLLAEETVRKFAPGQRLVLLADVFDHQVKENLPEAEDGIRLRPSKAYNNPICAFEAGLEAGK